MLPGPSARPEVVVDLAAIRHNVAVLREVSAPAQMMTVVKADGYGHGLVEVARAAREAGAEWVGAATVAEALALRAAGDTGRLLCWLDSPGPDPAAAVAADLDLAAYTVDDLDRLAAAADAHAPVARVHLKIDTGLHRGGAAAEDWPALVARAREHERAGALRVVGVFSHLAASDVPDHPANAAQQRAFADALDVAGAAGLRPEVRHLANSAGAMLHPATRYDLVRCGIATYGLDPAPGTTPPALAARLVPAMTVTAPLRMVKRVPAGGGVSYGHTWRAGEPTTLGLVPLGYGDGVPRHAGNTASVAVGGVRRPVRGRVCMDQLMVDLGGEEPAPGTPVVLFGPGRDGEPTAQDWAEACGTISYEIVTRTHGRLHRRYVDGRGADA